MHDDLLVKARHKINKFIISKCLLEVEVDPPLVVTLDPPSVVAGVVSNGTGFTSDEFIPTQPIRFTAVSCIRISSPQFGTMRVIEVDDEIVFFLMFRDGT